MGTFDDNRRGAGGDDEFRVVEFALDPPGVTSACCARSTASPSCPLTPNASRWTVRGYNIQVMGLERRLEAIGNRRRHRRQRGTRLDARLDRAAKAMDRLGRPRTDVHAFTLPGLRDRRGHDRATPPG
jgi:NAD+ synthase (glutamine-hydrolysing)